MRVGVHICLCAEKRKAEAGRIIEKYPDRIPVWSLPLRVSYAFISPLCIQLHQHDHESWIFMLLITSFWLCGIHVFCMLLITSFSCSFPLLINKKVRTRLHSDNWTLDMSDNPVLLQPTVSAWIFCLLILYVIMIIQLMGSCVYCWSQVSDFVAFMLLYVADHKFLFFFFMSANR